MTRILCTTELKCAMPAAVASACHFRQARLPRPLPYGRGSLRVGLLVAVGLMGVVVPAGLD